MNIKKIQAMDLHIQKITHYAIYTDIFARIINEFTQGGDCNLKPDDMSNLVEFLSIYARRTRICIINMKNDWEYK